MRTPFPRRLHTRFAACLMALTLLTAPARAAGIAAPDAVTAAINPFNSGKVRIAWNAVTGAQRYAVYRLDGTGAFHFLGRTAGASFSSRDYGEDAIYAVRSEDESGVQSESLSAATRTGQSWAGVDFDTLSANAKGTAAVAAASREDAEGSELERKTLTQINKERAGLDKAAYQWSSAAYTVAKQRVKEMRENDDFSHTTFAYGSVLETYAALTDVRPMSSGECIFASSRPFTAQTATEAWMNSPGHRDILLDNGGYGFTHGAVATGRYKTGTDFKYSGWYYAVLIVHR